MHLTLEITGLESSETAFFWIEINVTFFKSKFATENQLININERDSYSTVIRSSKMPCVHDWTWYP